MSIKTRFLSDKALQQQLPVFFQPWWLDMVSSNWNIALAEDEDGTKGAWPYCIDKKLGLTLIRNPLLTPYLGPFFFYPEEQGTEERSAFEEQVFEQLWQQLPRWDSFDVETTTSFDNASLFLLKEFNSTPKITYELEVRQPDEKLLAAMNSNHRNLIRQAAQCHTIEAGLENVPQLLNLHAATFSRKKKKYPFSAPLLHNLIKASAQREQGCVLAARDKQHRITAAIFTVWDHHKMYLLLSAADMDHVHQGTVRLLIWEAIRAARQKGLEQFDFEGSMDPGIAAFFSRFGGDKKTYLCLTRNKSKLWQLKKALLG